MVPLADVLPHGPLSTVHAPRLLSKSSLKESVQCGRAESMSTPGAARSTVRAPWLEKPASASALSVAATQITLAAG